jgi:hypothetical protein
MRIHISYSCYLFGVRGKCALTVLNPTFHRLFRQYNDKGFSTSIGSSGFELDIEEFTNPGFRVCDTNQLRLMLLQKLDQRRMKFVLEGPVRITSEAPGRS